MTDIERLQTLNQKFHGLRREVIETSMLMNNLGHVLDISLIEKELFKVQRKLMDLTTNLKKEETHYV